MDFGLWVVTSIYAHQRYQFFWGGMYVIGRASQLSHGTTATHTAFKNTVCLALVYVLTVLKGVTTRLTINFVSKDT